MRIFVWNVNGLLPTHRNIVLKQKSLKAFFDEHGADVVCFQEAKVPEDKLTRELACVDGFESFWSFSKAKKGYSGVVTWVRSQYSPVDAKVDFLGNGEDGLDDEGRVVLTDLGSIVIINVYVPNTGDAPERARLGFKLNFLKALKNKMDDLREQGRKVLVVGDFNVPMSENDVHPTFKLLDIYSQEEIDAMEAFLVDFVDTWRLKHPEENNTFTVWNERKNYRESNRGLRIDYALWDKELVDQLVSCEVIDTPRKWSDHAALLLEINGIEPPEAHPPCQLSSKNMKQFKSQKTIMSMFNKKRKQNAETSKDDTDHQDKKARNESNEDTGKEETTTITTTKE